MRKRIVPIILIVIALCTSNFILYPFTTFAEGVEVISFKKAERLLLINSNELRKIDSLLYSHKKNYDNALQKEIEDDVWYASDSYRRMLLLKTVELYPLQMEHALLSAEESLPSTRAKLILSLRDKYLTLLSTKQDITIKNMIYESELKVYDLSKLKYDNNLISRLELEEAEYDLFNKQTELNIAKRNYYNTCRNFNLFINCPVDVYYSEIEYDLLDKQIIYDLDYYVENTLKNNMQIKSLHREINLKLVEKELLERNYVYITYTNVNKQHKALISSINMLDLQLQRTKLDINKEIIDTYYNVVEAGEYIKKTEKKLDSTKARLYLTEAKIKAGVVPESRAEQIKIEIKQAEYEVLNAIFSYNTLLIKLNSAE